MKFQKYLRQQSIPEWAAAYVHYASLKRCIKNLMNTPSTEIPVGRFTQKLEREFSKVSLFYQKQHQKLHEAYDVSQRFLSGNHMTKKQRLQLKHQLINIHKEATFLINYLVLNKLAFYKICKKFDKRFGTALQATFLETRINPDDAIFQDTRLHKLRQNVENDLVNGFYVGNRKRARERLRKEEDPQEVSHAWHVWRCGLYVGASLVLISQVVVYLFENNYEPHLYILLHLHGATFLVVMMILGLAICYYIWSLNRINFPFIMELDSRSILSKKQFAELASFFLLLWSISFFLTVYPLAWITTTISKYVYLIIFGIFMLWLLCPARYFLYYTRKWFLKKLCRIMIIPTFRTVYFADFFIADLMISLGFFWISFYIAVCYYSSGHTHAFLRETCKPQDSWIPVVLLSYPFLIRSSQCLKRYHDDPSRHRLQVINFGKYCLGLCAVILSTTRLTTVIIFPLWIYFASVSAVYSTCWDIFIDWGLTFNRGFVPQGRTFSKPFYITASCIDAVLRFAWFSLLNTSFLLQSRMWAFVLAVLEVGRRCLWMLLRIESEHANNIENYRAVKEIPLPDRFQIDADQDLEGQDDDTEDHDREETTCDNLLQHIATL